MTADARPFDPLGVDLAGRHLIEASAGTGKTFTLAHLYLRLIVEKEMQPSEVLVVTYTNAAAAELRSRIRKRLREAIDGISGKAVTDSLLADWLALRRAHADHDLRQLTDCLNQFDLAAIHTIHAFCQRILQENAFEARMPLDRGELVDDGPVISEIVKDFLVARLYGEATEVVDWLMRHGLSIKFLQKLANELRQQHGAELTPPRPLALQVERARKQIDDARRVAGAIWRSDREDILGRIERSGLNKRSYQPTRLRAVWAPALDEAFESPLAPGKDAAGFIGKMVLEEMRTKLNKNGALPEHPFFEACGRMNAAIETFRSEMDGFRISLLHDFAEELDSELARRKRAGQTHSYSDWLNSMHSALRDDRLGLAALLRKRYPAALIDEFQDTDPVQYAIFRKIYDDPEAGLFLIGDPKQAIYGFRGADIFTYIRAQQEPGVQRHSLTINYRSDPSLLRALNALYGRAQVPFVYEEIEYVDVSAPTDRDDRIDGGAGLEILWFDTNRAEALHLRQLTDAVAGEIRTLLDSGVRIGSDAIRASDIAVLCRTNIQGDAMRSALQRLGLHCVLQSEESVFASSDARDVLRVLSALAEPADRSAVKAALVTPIFGLDAVALDALKDDESDWDLWANRFTRWSTHWDERGFATAWRELLRECDVPARLLTRIDGERRLTNTLHLGELLHQAASQSALGRAALVNWLHRLVTDPDVRVPSGDDSAQLRIESDQPAIQLVTIHKSKGLEFPIVVCPFLTDGKVGARGAVVHRYHDNERNGRLTLSLEPPVASTGGNPASEEEFAESTRLLYVALTRAKHRCIVVWGATKESSQAALGYLLHQARDAQPSVRLWNLTAERQKNQDDAGRLADLEELVASADGTIRLRNLAIDPVPAASTPPELAEPLRLRAETPDVPPGRRLSSFSAMASSAPPNEAAAEGIDHDAIGDRSIGSVPVASTSDFSGGARIGQLIHAVFERIDFLADGEEVQRRTRDECARFGIGEREVEALAAAIGGALTAELSDGQRRFRLADIAADRCLREMEFFLPVGLDRADVTPKRLEHAFRANALPAASGEYAESLGRLRFAQWNGFLRGFVDLVFEYDGRWFVVDYKSNRVGGGYAGDHLHPVMAEHHYYLQYHLYSLALDRYLQTRVPNYEHERHFGGVFYLFLRGMTPSQPRGSGVFFDRPSGAMLGGLAEALGLR